MKFKSLRSFNMNFKPVIRNTPLLYTITILSCLDIMYMFQSNKFNALFVFFLTAMIMTYFSKNMMIILFFALVVTHIFRFGSTVSEGMESKPENKDDAEPKNKDDAEPKNKDDVEPKNKGKLVNDSNNVDDMVDKMIQNMSEEDKNELIEKKDEITGDFQEVLKLQETMVSNVKSLEPLLTKAESFMQRYGKYAEIQ